MNLGNWYAVKDGDAMASAMYERHYSCVNIIKRKRTGVYETWLEQMRIKPSFAAERTAEIFRLPETQVRRIVRVISRWRARSILRRAYMSSYYWREPLKRLKRRKQVTK